MFAIPFLGAHPNWMRYLGSNLCSQLIVIDCRCRTSSNNRLSCTVAHKAVHHADATLALLARTAEAPTESKRLASITRSSTRTFSPSSTQITQYKLEAERDDKTGNDWCRHRGVDLVQKAFVAASDTQVSENLYKVQREWASNSRNSLEPDLQHMPE